MDRIVWVDLETTGLDRSYDPVLELAVVVTDVDLDVLVSGSWFVCPPRAFNWRARMNEWARKTHTESGLLDQVDSGIPLFEATRHAVELISPFVDEGQAPMGGRNVSGFDRQVLSQQHGGDVLNSYCHYRSVDVSGIECLARLWRGDEFVEQCRNESRPGTHRALDDCHAAIEQLRWYRDRLFLAE
jgi:oligoribonuclease